MDDTDEKTKEVKRTLSCSDLIKISSARYREAARMYAGHWDFVKKEEADKICWVRFQPKKCDLQVKIDQESTQIPTECCIHIPEEWSSYNKDIKKFETKIESSKKKGARGIGGGIGTGR